MFLKNQNSRKCSPDPTSNSETTNPNFHDLFYQLGQVLHNLQVFVWYLLMFSDLGFVISELVVGFGEYVVNGL